MRWSVVLPVFNEAAFLPRTLRSQLYGRDFWCVASDRRAEQRAVRWTLAERLAYHFTPFALKDAFFHQFLARRFEARDQRDVVLRQRDGEFPKACDQ